MEKALSETSFPYISTVTSCVLFSWPKIPIAAAFPSTVTFLPIVETLYLPLSLVFP